MQKYEINTINIHLYDLDTRSYDFYVDLILDDQTLQRVYDTTAASSWITINFPSVLAKGVRIFSRKGNTVNNYLHIVKL